MSQRLVPLSVGVGVACAWAVAFLGAQSRPAPAGPGQPAVDFATEIHPVLQAKCLGCHGDKLKLSKLDLRTRESAIEGGAHGAALVPGNAERVRCTGTWPDSPSRRCRCAASRSAAAEVAALKRWIDEGARVDAAAAATAAAPADAAAMFEDRPLTDEERSYWAFKRPMQTPLPSVQRKNLTSAIDRFLEQARASRGMTAAPRADRRTLVRRAYLDLVGLPPSPEQVARFVADDRPDAWERLIDSLLASPHYGERYGRHWLDVARYADSGGFEYDVHRPNAWRYRDYVIRAFNDDKPFDQFLVEQIAGDEMDGKIARQHWSRPASCGWARACCSVRRTTPSAASTTSTTCWRRSARARWG